MKKVRLDEAQVEIKMVWRNINNLRYEDDNTLMAENEEELKSLLMKVKGESEKASLKVNIQKTKTTTSNPIISWQIDGGGWKQWKIIFSWAPKSLQTDCSHKIKRCLLLGRSRSVSHSFMSNSATPHTVVHQASLSMGFSKKEYWSGLSFPSPEDFPNPRIEPWSPALQADSFTV